MRWPWQKREKRESGGDFTDAVVRLIEAQAAGSAADASSTAAVEAASGALSRAFASARVEASEPWARDAVTPVVLAQVGRDLIRSGDSMHVIDVDRDGRVTLLPCSSWHFEGDAHPASWTVRATFYGPSTSTTRHLPFRRRRIRSLGIDAGAAVHRDGAALLDAHYCPAAERNRTVACRRVRRSARAIARDPARRRGR